MYKDQLLRTAVARGACTKPSTMHKAFHGAERGTPNPVPIGGDSGGNLRADSDIVCSLCRNTCH
jgi:hypothetical protein